MALRMHASMQPKERCFFSGKHTTKRLIQETLPGAFKKTAPAISHPSSMARALECIDLRRRVGIWPRSAADADK